MAADEEEKPFKVEDRRRFSESGEARSEVKDSVEPEQKETQNEPTAEPYLGPGSEAAEITFASFVIGLSTQALAHLGEIAHPEHGRREVDLMGARHIIDILGLLQEKTSGNLDDGERALLESALYDLRMLYVQKKRNSSS